MQNKPNFRKAKMKLNFYSTKDYENKPNWKLGKNKANTNPIRANLLDAQMNLSSVLTKDYSDEQRTMNNERLCKTNPIKPNFIRQSCWSEMRSEMIGPWQKKSSRELICLPSWELATAKKAGKIL